MKDNDTQIKAATTDEIVGSIKNIFMESIKQEGDMKDNDTQRLIKFIKEQAAITSTDEIVGSVKNIFMESREKNVITTEEFNTVITRTGQNPDEKMCFDILAKLPVEDKNAVMLDILIFLFRWWTIDKQKNETGNDIQKELFPLFKPQKFVNLKKEFILNFGGLERIEKEYKHLLKEKLTSGMTLQEHINKVKNWFNSLRGEDLGNWIKLFAYVKAVKEFSETEDDAANFREISPGRYCFSIKRNGDFYSFFIRPDKTSGQFTTKAKNKILKWLYDNQTAIEFPMILNGEVWNIPMRIYEYAENVSKKEITFVVDTNILESEFKDYVSINIGEIDAIEEAWETLAEQNPDFSRKRYSLNNFVDVPLKFLLTLKNIYSREGDFKNDTGTFTGNVQRLSGDSLDAHLGVLSERVTKHLMKRDRLRTGKSGKLAGDIVALILETTFTIAKERGWILSLPDYKGGIYKFNINPGYFDRAHTARRIKTLKSPETP